MTTARDIMNGNPPFCEAETPIREIAARFAAENITGMLVVDEEKRLLGVITESDLLDQQRQLHLPTAIAIFDMVIPLGEARFEKELSRMQAMTALDLMSVEVQSVDAAAPLSEVATRMSDGGIHHLPVLEEGAVVGLIDKHHLIKALVGHFG